MTIFYLDGKIMGFLDNLFPTRQRVVNIMDLVSRMEKRMSAFSDALAAVGLQLEKARGEIVSKIEALEARESITGDDLAALNAIKEAAQKLDDIVPDVVEGEAEEPAVEHEVVVEDETPAVEETPAPAEGEDEVVVEAPSEEF